MGEDIHEPTTARVQLVRVAPTSDDEEVEYILEVQTPTMDVRRRSPRLARPQDQSSLIKLQWCDDTIRHLNDGEESVEPRVLISRAAKAIWDEGSRGSFSFTTFSLRCLTGQSVPPLPEVSHIHWLLSASLQYFAAALSR